MVGTPAALALPTMGPITVDPCPKVSLNPTNVGLLVVPQDQNVSNQSGTTLPNVGPSQHPKISLHKELAIEEISALANSTPPPWMPLAKTNNPEKNPEIPYLKLCAAALLSFGEPTLLADIYEWISAMFPYYKPSQKSWKNSVRHSLFADECFIQAHKASKGKGHHWWIHEAFLPYFLQGNFDRRQIRRKIKQSTVAQSSHNQPINRNHPYLSSTPIRRNALAVPKAFDNQTFSPIQEQNRQRQVPTPAPEHHSITNYQNMHSQNQQQQPQPGIPQQQYPNFTSNTSNTDLSWHTERRPQQALNSPGVSGRFTNSPSHGFHTPGQEYQPQFQSPLQERNFRDSGYFNSCTLDQSLHQQQNQHQVQHRSQMDAGYGHLTQQNQHQSQPWNSPKNHGPMDSGYMPSPYQLNYSSHIIHNAYQHQGNSEHSNQLGQNMNQHNTKNGNNNEQNSFQQYWDMNHQGNSGYGTFNNGLSDPQTSQVTLNQQPYGRQQDKNTGQQMQTPQQQFQS